jgi:transposase
MVIVGIDWARYKHDYLIMAPTGEILQRGTITHNADGLQNLADAIECHAPDNHDVQVAIEMNDGAILAWLIGQGYEVFGIQPKSSQRAREIYRPSGAKDDPIDTFVLAEMIRIKGGRLRPLRPNSPATDELRDLVRWRNEVVHQRTAATQQLRAVLADWAPILSGLCDDLERKWQLDLLEEFSIEADFCNAHGNRIRGFVKAHRLCARTGEKIDNARRSEPMMMPSGRVRTIVRQVKFLVDQLRRFGAEIDLIEQDMEKRVAQHPDANIFRSLPIKATVTIASLLSIFGQDRQHAPTWEELAACCGVAPVTVASGKSRNVRLRRACNHASQQAMLYFAFNTAFAKGCWAVEYYKRKRQEGMKHYAALRCLGKRWMKLLYRLWKDKLMYDEQLHRRSQKNHGQHAA